MKPLAKILIWIIRVLAIVIATWQVIGLLPALSWLSSSGDVGAGMWMMLIIKVLILAICVGVFVIIGKLLQHLNRVAAQ